MNLQPSLPLPPVPAIKALLVAAALVLAAVLATVATPKLDTSTPVADLNATVPHAFGDWVEVPNGAVQVSLSATAIGERSMDQPYDQTVMRTYRNTQGQVVYLALAWGRNQRQEVKIHRPDLCYVAQGYQVKSLTDHSFDDIQTESNIKITGKFMLATAGQSTENVLYWMRLGNIFSENAVDTRVHIFRQGLAGKTTDGILVRASTRTSGTDKQADKYNEVLLNEFLTALYRASPQKVRAMLAS